MNAFRTSAAAAQAALALALATAPLGAVSTHRVELAPTAPEATPPLPPLDVYPVQLVLDDDQAEAAVGVTEGVSAKQWLWFNQFTAPERFRLEEVWVLFPAEPGVVPGAAIQLVVFADGDADPANGATFRAAFDETVQVADGDTFSVYTLAAPVDFEGGQRVLIGVVDRFVESGVTPPVADAAVDTTASAGQSWLAVWVADPPNPPSLPADLLTARLDDVVPTAAGNWMIRGFGTPVSLLEVPAAGGFGLAALAALLAIAGALRLARRTRSSHAV